MRNSIYNNICISNIWWRFNKVLLTISFVVTYLPSASAQDYYFDPALLKGSALGQDMERFNKKITPVQSGKYVLDVYVNNTLISISETINIMEREDGKTEPCLTRELIAKLAIRINAVVAAESHQCVPVSDAGATIQAEVDLSQSRLNLSVPQSNMFQNPRGFIPVESWDSGVMALFLRHNTNFTRTENTGTNFKYNYLWSNINAGTNLG
ncbi:fimbrial assembly protein, partial [Klebsiella michiganensis]